MMDFVRMCLSLFPDSPALLREKTVGKGHMEITDSKSIRLSDVPEFHGKGGGISRTGA